MKELINKMSWNKGLLVTLFFNLPIILSAQKISISNGCVLYVCEDSTISAIGNNSNYQLGDGTNINREYPVKVKGLHNVISVNAHGSLALLNDGTVWQWLDKNNIYGIKKIDVENVVAISSGDGINSGKYYCALKSDGTLWLWGDLEKKNTLWWGYTDTIEKMDIPKVAKVQGGNDCVIALGEDGTVYTWGSAVVSGNGDSPWGYPNYQIFKPQKVTTISNITDITTIGYETVSALKADGTVWYWGFLTDYNTDIPYQMKLTNVKSIFAGHDYSDDGFYALQNNGDLIFINGLLWNPNRIDTISNIKNITYVASCGESVYDWISTYLMDANGNKWRWGNNNYGQLGNFTIFPIDSPEIMPHPCVAVNCDTITKNPDTLKLDTSVYPGVPVKLISSHSDADLYWWYPRSKIIKGKFSQTATVEIADSTMFTAVIMDTYGCMRKENFILRKKCDPNTKLIFDSITYPGAHLVLKADTGSLYSWTPLTNLSCPNCRNTLATIKDSVTYTVSYTDTFTCPASSKFIIKIRNCDTSTINNPKLVLDTVTYPNSKLDLLVPVKKIYSWQPETGLSCTNCNNPIATVTDSIEYIASLTDSFNCVTKEKFIIRIRNCDTIEKKGQVLRLDTVIHYTTEIPLIASKSYNEYNWTPTNGLSCNDCQNPILTANSTSDYIVELSDAWRCPFKEEFKITMVKIDVVIPNVISPNYGINVYFEIKGLIPGSNLKIFDSNGRLVFSSENYQNNWNGKDASGKDLNEGTYWYILNVPESGNFKGWIYLKR